jgi:gas vesicle protein
MDSGKILLGVLAGVAAGIVLGFLFAPDKGWNTRKRIDKKLGDYSYDVQDKFGELLSGTFTNPQESDLLTEER